MATATATAAPTAAMAPEIVSASQNSFRVPRGLISLDRNHFYTGPPEKPTFSSRHRAITAPEKEPTSKTENTTKERPLTPTIQMAEFLGLLYSDDEDEHTDKNPNHGQVTEDGSQANPVVIEDDGDEAGDEASGSVEPLGSGDRELPSLQEILQHQTIHDNTKLAAPDGKQTDSPAEGCDATTATPSMQRPGTYAAADQEPSGAEDAESLDTDNPSAAVESDGEKVMTRGELSIKKRKLDQLKLPDDVEYDSDHSAKESNKGGEGLRPRKQQKPHASRRTSSPGLDLNSSDDKHNSSDGNSDNEAERAASSAWPASPSHQDQNLDDPVNNLTAEEKDDGDDDDSNDGGEDEDEDSYNDGDDDNNDDSDESDDESDKDLRCAERQTPSTSPIRSDSFQKRAAKHHAQHCRRSTSTSFVHKSDWGTAHTSNRHTPLAQPGPSRRRARKLSLTDSLPDSGGAEEWPIHGILRHKEKGSFTIELRLDHPHHQLPSPVGSVKQSQKPRPKSRFTAKENEVLIDLKENKNKPWEQIQKRFPGRTVGSLQVHYCTKLKNRTAVTKKRWC